jgi:hypothetical protein
VNQQQSRKRCQICDYPISAGLLCRLCESKKQWLEETEYFCTSKECGRFLPGATQPGLCDVCKKLAQIPEKPIKKPANEPKPQEQKMIEKPESTCEVCGKKLTKNGFCSACHIRKIRANAQTEKPLCNETSPKVTQEKSNVTFEPAANTIHASPPPKPVVEIEEADVCRRAINQYGLLRQMAKAAEEFAEAAAAINRHMATEGSREEIVSELADVEVMCVQMRMIFGAASIDTARAEKVARLHGRLEP